MAEVSASYMLMVFLCEMFGEVICFVMFSLVPKQKELFSFNSIFDPIDVHVKIF